MSLSLVQYSDVEFQPPTLGMFTQFAIHSHIISSLASKHESFDSFFQPTLNRGPGFDPIVGSRAVPETQ